MRSPGGTVFIIDPSNFTIPYDFALLKGLLANGWDAHLIGRDPRPNEATESETIAIQPHFSRAAERWRLKRLPGLVSAAAKAVELPRDHARLLWSLRKNPGSVLHYQWSVLPLVDILYMRRALEVHPVVLTVHDTLPFLGSATSPLQYLGWRRLLDVPDLLIVHTTAGRDTLVKMGVALSRIEVIPHGQLSAPSSSARAGTSQELQYVNRAKCVLLLAGHIKPYKGLGCLLNAIASLSTAVRQDVQLIVAGQPSDDAPDYVKMAERLGLKGEVTFRLQFLDEAELGKLLSCASIVVFPYTAIDASGMFLQVAGLGKAVIATDVGIFREVIKNEIDGLIVPPNDHVALANAIERLVSDHGLRAAIGAGLANRMNTVPSWNEIARTTAGVYLRASQRWRDRDSRRNGAPSGDTSR